MRQIDFQEISEYTVPARGKIDMIYLHWSAGRYGQHFNDYHLNIDSDGSLWTDMNSFTDYKAHTWHRNSRAIGIALDCCYGASIWADGTIEYGDYPPTDTQIDTLAKVVAKILIEIGLPLYCVMTHAEAADEDGYGLNGSDPDMRWDLYGRGDEIRSRIANYMDAWTH